MQLALDLGLVGPRSPLGLVELDVLVLVSVAMVVMVVMIGVMLVRIGHVVNDTSTLPNGMQACQ